MGKVVLATALARWLPAAARLRPVHALTFA